MKTLLKSIEELSYLLATVTAIAVAFYGVLSMGVANAMYLAIGALLISIALKLILRTLNKKESPKQFSLQLTHGEPCALGEYEPGFFLFNETLCYKNEYNEAFIVSSGEMFWGGVHIEKSEWLSDNIRERDAMDWDYEIEDLEEE